MKYEYKYITLNISESTLMAANFEGDDSEAKKKISEAIKECVNEQGQEGWRVKEFAALPTIWFERVIE